jgi:hypothetical protein
LRGRGGFFVPANLIESQCGSANEALNFYSELQAKKVLSAEEWQYRVEQNLQFYIREYLVEENITKYSYRLKRDSSGLPTQIYVPG